MPPPGGRGSADRSAQSGAFETWGVRMLLKAWEGHPGHPEEPETDPVERAIHERWLAAAAGRDPQVLLEHLYGLLRRRRGYG